jgi:hypothetical protein
MRTPEEFLRNGFIKSAVFYRITYYIFTVFPRALERCSFSVQKNTFLAEPSFIDCLSFLQSASFFSVAKQQLFYRYISFLDWISTFIYKEIYEKFQQELITGMNPKASFGNIFAASCWVLNPPLRGIIRLTNITALRL